MPVALSVDGDRLPSVVLKPERSDDATAAHCTPGCALHTVQRGFRDQIGWLRRPESKILGVHAAIHMKMGLVAEPDSVKELIVLLAISQKPAAVKKP